MSFNLDQLFVQQYGSTLELLTQQFMSKLRGTVMEGMHVGETASPVDQEGPVDVITPAGRGAPMGRVDSRVDRRWVDPNDKELPQLIYSFDKLRVLIDPTSQKIRNMVAAFGRAWDRQILAQFRGSNKTGKTGGVTTNFLAGNKIAAGGTALTVSKLKEAAKILKAHDVDFDMEEVYVVLNAEQEQALLEDSTNQLLSMDYTGGRNLESGRINKFLGFKFINCERVTELRSGTTDTIPVYCKSGMYLGFWKDLRANISQRNDLAGEPWQAYGCSTFGATRIEEVKCVEIACTV